MISIPFIVCLVGLIIYAIGSEWWVKPQLAEVGRLMFMIGLFWTLAPYAGKVAF